MDLLGLPLRWPLIGAPMAGGPSTPALAAAVTKAGGLGFVAAGYLSAKTLEQEIVEVRRLGVAFFGVNVFVPGKREVDEAALGAYIDSLRPEAQTAGVDVTPSWDDDAWDEKIDVLVRQAVPVVSFTFGCPPAEVLSVLHQAGSRVVITVTTPAEAAWAADAGADAVCAQGIEAGGHQSTFDDTAADDGFDVLSLVHAVRHEVQIPVIGAGGLMTGAGVAEVIGAGAVAAQLGTALLRCPESGASALHKSALSDPAFAETAITRAFSGRRARGLLNAFMRAHPDAPSAYPHINNATRALRRAALARHDPQTINMWAGEGYRLAQARPAADVITTIGTQFENQASPSGR